MLSQDPPANAGRSDNYLPAEGWLKKFLPFNVAAGTGSPSSPASCQTFANTGYETDNNPPLTQMVLTRSFSLLLFQAQFHPSMYVYREKPDIHAKTPRGNLSREVAFSCGDQESESWSES